jgi:hypothetical protein
MQEGEINLQEKLSIIAWKILFGDAFDRTLDPNDPVNVPVIKAKQRQQVEKFKAFMHGPGKVLFDQWQTELRGKMFGLLSREDTDCLCRACGELAEMRYLLKLIAKAQFVLEKTNAD